MTEDPDGMTICPNCGEKNLPRATRCVHCGNMLDSLFRIEGEDDLGADANETGNQDSDSLPGILQSLHKDETFKVNSQDDLQGAPAGTTEEDSSSPEKGQSQSQVPDWLERIRKRAKKEEDSSGDLVKGINAMSQSVSQDAQSRVEGEFSDWIERIREKARRDNLNQVRAIEARPVGKDEDPDWLKRIKELQPKPEDEDTHEVAVGKAETKKRSSDWDREWTDEDLAALRKAEMEADQKGETEPVFPIPSNLSTEQPQEDANVPPEVPLTEIPPIENVGAEQPSLSVSEDKFSEVPPENQSPGEPESLHNISDEEEPVDELVSPEPLEKEPDETEAEETPPEAVSEDKYEDQENPQEKQWEETGFQETVPDLLLQRSQYDRAELVNSILEQEGRPSRHLRTTKPIQTGLSRLILGLLLLVGILGAIFIGPSNTPESVPSAPVVAFKTAIGELSASDKLLIVLDYQAATSSEMEQLALPVLKALDRAKIPMTALIQHPSGLWLGEQMLTAAELANQPTLNYLPGGQLSLLALSAGTQGTLKANVNASTIAEGIGSLRDYQSILIISDSADSVRGWMEQVEPWLEKRRILAISSAQEAPMIQPYYDSGQINGYLAGLKDTNAIDSSSEGKTNFRAFQAGLLIMIVLILLGMISKMEKDAALQHEKDRKA